jgi:hypothetical protein
VAGEFEISDVGLPGEQARSQRTGVCQKVLLKACFARPNVSEQFAFVFSKKDNRPFVEDDLFVLCVHLASARNNPLFGLVKCHRRKNVENRLSRKQFQGHRTRQFAISKGEGQIRFSMGWGRVLVRAGNFVKPERRAPWWKSRESVDEAQQSAEK